jgi:hypothetical protein
LTQPISTLDRRIEYDGQQQLGGCWQGLWAMPSWAAKGGGGWYPPHRGATRAKQAVGRVRLRAKLNFLYFYLQNTVLIFFVQILGKF